MQTIKEQWEKQFVPLLRDSFRDEPLSKNRFYWGVEVAVETIQDALKKRQPIDSILETLHQEFQQYIDALSADNS